MATERQQTLTMSKSMTFDSAYQVLDAAFNDQQLPPLRSLIDNEIEWFHSSLRIETAKSLNELDRGREELTSFAKELASLGISHATDVIEQVDVKVKENPLLFIGLAAAGALAIGYSLSRPRLPRSFKINESASDSFGERRGVL